MGAASIQVYPSENRWTMCYGDVYGLPRMSAVADSRRCVAQLAGHCTEAIAKNYNRNKKTLGNANGHESD